MLKKFIIYLLFACVMAPAFAQKKADSVAYELQRKKINSLLAQRTAKFGQYDVSLKKHTGIFGLQTKKDIRRSNNILMNIVETDNNIFRELKILLDYRTFQQEQAQAQSQERENDRIAFINALNKMRKQREEITAKLQQQEHEAKNTQRNYIITIGVLLVLCVTFILLLIKKRVKA